MSCNTNQCDPCLPGAENGFCQDITAQVRFGYSNAQSAYQSALSAKQSAEEAAGSVGTSVQKAGDTMTGPLNIQTSNSNPALKIVQTGSGAGLLVEDSTSPDSTPFIITSTGDVGIGLATPSQKLDVVGKIKSTLDSTFNEVRVGKGGGNLARNVTAGVLPLEFNSTGNDNTAIGYGAMNVNQSGSNNVAVGSSALLSNTIGALNTAVGYGSLNRNISGNNNTAVGTEALVTNNTGYENTAVGRGALATNSTGYANTALGVYALNASTVAFGNVAVGHFTSAQNITGNNNVSIGTSALNANQSGGENVAVGVFAQQINSVNQVTAIGAGALQANQANQNVAVGYVSLNKNTTGSSNTSTGVGSLTNCTTGSNNTSVGANSLFNCTTQSGNTAVGTGALNNFNSGVNNTAVGFQAAAFFTNPTNTTSLGYNATPTGNNQVQLGDLTTTVYVTGTVQTRSDIRDKTEIRDTVLGLDFIKAIRPVDYKWDYRQDYIPEFSKTEPIAPLSDASEEEKNKYKQEKEQYDKELKEYLDKRNLSNIVKDGSKVRTRYHHGVIAQEIKAILDQKGIDFGGYQDHKIKGGADVLTVGYTEFIGPIIKAIQEQQVIIDDLKQQIAELKK
jgi:hypothetical protein